MNKILLILILILVISGCSGKNTDQLNENDNQLTDDTQKTVITKSATTTIPCFNEEEFDVSLSYDRFEVMDVEKTEIRTKTLNYEIKDFEKKITNEGINEYIFFKNNDFVWFTNDMAMAGIYKNSGIIEVKNVDTSQTIPIKNVEDDSEGIYEVERIFPGKKKGYYLKDSRNIIKVRIPAGETVNVTFDQGVLCYKIAEVKGEVNLMQYFIEQTKKINDQKDLIVDRRGDILFTCERAHYRIIPPEISYEVVVEKEDHVILNEQGSDVLIKFNECDNGQSDQVEDETL